MERTLWPRLRELATEACSRISHPGVRFSDRWVLLVYLWAVLHDRPTSWACRPESWPADLRPLALPTQPTMSRRLRTAHVQWALALILERLRSGPPPGPPAGGPGRGPPAAAEVRAGLVKWIDGMPLRVGGFSKDPDARRGYGAGLKYRGYKLHALWGPGPVPLAWEVRPADRAESTEADRLLPHLVGFGYVAADAAYDCNRLYDLAMEHGHQLVAPPKRPGAGLGHCYQSPHRLRGLELLGLPIGRRIYATRSAVERRFGGLTGFGGGLAGLPGWVRRAGRVGMWVQAKLIINGVRASLRSRLTA